MINVKDIAAAIISPLLAFGSPFTANLESRVQAPSAIHAQVSHNEFFRKEIADRVQDLLRRKVPFNSGGYDDIIEKIIQDYGLPFRKGDIVSSKNFVLGYVADHLFIGCDLGGPDGSKIHAIWVYPNQAVFGGIDRDNDSPLAPIVYYPIHGRSP